MIVLTLILLFDAVMLLNIINYVDVVLSNLGNWCGTPEAGASIVLLVQGFALYCIYDVEKRSIERQEQATDHDAKSRARLKRERFIATITKLLLVAAVIVMAELIILQMIVR